MKNLYFCILVFFISFISSGQNYTIDVDSIYNDANTLYTNKLFIEAIEKSNEGLSISPNYSDLRLLKIRSYHQLLDMENAKDEINILLNKESLKSTNTIIEKHISLFTNTDSLKQFEVFLQTKEVIDNYKFSLALAYLNLGSKTEALKLSKTLDRTLFNDANFYEYYSFLKRLNDNKVSLNAELNTFNKDYSNRKSWQVYGLGYTKNFNNVTTSLFVSKHFRSNNEGLLYEIEAYPILSKSVYGYINVNVGDALFLQDYGINSSIYYTYKSFAEFELGFRYLKFTTINVTSPVFGITKYVGNYYINARVLLGFNTNNESFQNYQLNIRRYLKRPEDYIFIRLGTGVSPDDNNRFSQVVNNPDLVSKYANLGLNKWFNNFNLNTSIGFLSQDLSNNSAGNQFIINTQLAYRF